LQAVLQQTPSTQKPLAHTEGVAQSPPIGMPVLVGLAVGVCVTVAVLVAVAVEVLLGVLVGEAVGASGAVTVTVN